MADGRSGRPLRIERELRKKPGGDEGDERNLVGAVEDTVDLCVHLKDEVISASGQDY